MSMQWTRMGPPLYIGRSAPGAPPRLIASSMRAVMQRSKTSPVQPLFILRYKIRAVVEAARTRPRRRKAKSSGRFLIGASVRQSRTGTASPSWNGPEAIGSEKSLPAMALPPRTATADHAKNQPVNETGDSMSKIRVLVGTKKGAFILTADGKRQNWEVSGPHFAGWEMYHLKGSPADPNRIYASQSSGWFGQIIQRSDDGGKTWNTPGSSPEDLKGPEGMPKAESNKFVYEG